jgi:hypothetical protein
MGGGEGREGGEGKEKRKRGKEKGGEAGELAPQTQKPNSAYDSYCMEWHLLCYFSDQHGVKQGGVLSPILFCVYLDGLLKLLAAAKVGCFIGTIFVGGPGICG